MNVLKHDLRQNLKSFVFWAAGTAFLLFAGITKYEGMQTGVDIGAFMQKFPRIFLALFGMVDLDLTRLADYFAVLGYLALLMVAVYAQGLGANAVTREALQRTEEFLFSKPRSRNQILTAKLSAAVINLTGFTILFDLCSLLAVRTVSDQDISWLIHAYALAVLLTGLVFMTVSVLLSAAVTRPESARTAGNMFFLLAFFLAVASDLLEAGNWLRYLTPLKYYPAPELVAGEISLVATLVLVLLVAGCLAATYHFFNRRDLTLQT